MALEWIKSFKKMESDPKTLEFMSLMEWSLSEAIGFLHRFWWWALDVAPDGVVTDVCRPGVMGGRFGFKQSVASKVVENLQKVGWVDTLESGELVIHSHDKYRSSSPEKKESDRERQQKHRASRKRHNDVTRDKRVTNVASHDVTLLDKEEETDKETTLSLSREGEEKESSDGISSEYVTPPPAPPEMTDSLLVVAREVVSQMPEGQVRLLLIDGHPPDWIELALKEAGYNGVRGTRAIPYARKILQTWRKEGGPPKHDDRIAGQSPSRPNAGKARTPDYSTTQAGAEV